MKKENKKLPAAEVKKIKKAMAIMNEEYNQPLTVAEVARRVGMEPEKLRTGIKAHFYLGFREYQYTLRIGEAFVLLLNRKNKLRIYEIAYEIGYSSSQSFSRRFKSYTGMAPKPWRELQHSAPRGTYPWVMKPLFPEKVD
jgi:two-component system response regulator YesN